MPLRWERALAAIARHLFPSVHLGAVSLPPFSGLLLCISVVYRTGFQPFCMLKWQNLSAWPLLCLSRCLSLRVSHFWPVGKESGCVHVPLPALGEELLNEEDSPERPNPSPSRS